MRKICLLLVLLCVGAPALHAHETAPVTDAGETSARDDFARRMDALQEAGDWNALIQSARAWQKSHPDDANGWWYEAKGKYMLGDFNTAISDWQRSNKMNPSFEADTKSWLDAAMGVRANFPNAHLRPLEFVGEDTIVPYNVWLDRGYNLLNAHNYDEIERVARQLQSTNAASVKGNPYLGAFFDGLCGGTETANDALPRVAAWRRARPDSDLARVAAVQIWTNEAWRIRGGGYANTITPDMSAKMDTALGHAFGNLKAWPKTAFNSPLAFMVAMNWGQLSGVGRPFLDGAFQAGTARFPSYLPLYATRANLLLPRWFGEPGEWESMAKKRADALGGEAGDIFYARVVWRLTQDFGDLSKESSFSYARVQRGLAALQRKRPNSLSVSSARLAFALDKSDWPLAKTLFLRPNGNFISDRWYEWGGQQGRNWLCDQRTLVLAIKAK